MCFRNIVSTHCYLCPRIKWWQAYCFTYVGLSVCIHVYLQTFTLLTPFGLYIVVFILGMCIPSIRYFLVTSPVTILSPWPWLCDLGLPSLGMMCQKHVLFEITFHGNLTFNSFTCYLLWDPTSCMIKAFALNKNNPNTNYLRCLSRSCYCSAVHITYFVVKGVTTLLKLMIKLSYLLLKTKQQKKTSMDAFCTCWEGWHIGINSSLHICPSVCEALCVCLFFLPFGRG